MIGPDDIRDMRPESPMPRPERSAEWLDGWRAAQEAGARTIWEHSDKARRKLGACTYEGHPEDAQTWSAIIAHLDIAHEAILAMRPEDQP